MECSAFLKPARLVISYSYPHIIVETDNPCSFLHLENVMGQALEVFFGPKTDIFRLFDTIQSCAHHDSTSMFLILYNHLGDEVGCTATFTAVRGASDHHDLDLCAIALHRSPRPPSLDFAFDHGSHAAAWVSAVRPHIVQAVNPAFARRFLLSQHHVAGATLTPLLAPPSDPAAWRRLFAAAADGCAASARFPAAIGPDSHLAIAVVPEACSEGRQHRLLVLFCGPGDDVWAPLIDKNTAGFLHRHGPPLPTEPRLVCLPARNPPALHAGGGEGCAAAAAAAGRPPPAIRIGRARGLVIFPRRKGGGSTPAAAAPSGIRSGPVTVTVELLQVPHRSRAPSHSPSLRVNPSHPESNRIPVLIRVTDLEPSAD